MPNNPNDIILLQSLYIGYLNEAISELISVVADQYDRLHKPKRGRKLRDSKANTSPQLTPTPVPHRTITEK